MMRSRSNNKKIALGHKIGLVLFGLTLSVVLLEGALRIGGVLILSIQEYMNIVSARQEGTYRILCLGESTTALGSSSKPYPSQLEEILNTQNLRIKFSVINKGIIATDTTAILSKLEENIEKYKPNMLITMMGINDEEYYKGIVDVYEDGAVYRVKQFLRSFKTYKLIRLLGKHIGAHTGTLDRPTIREDEDKGLFEEYLALGDAYRLSGEYGKAEKMLKKAIKINPKEVSVYASLAWNYLYSDKLEQAEEMFRSAIEINQFFGGLYNGLGQIYIRKGDYKRAQEMYAKAVEISPADNFSRLELVRIYSFQKEYDKIEKLLKQGLKYNHGDNRLYGALGVFYGIINKDKTAKELFGCAEGIRSRYYSVITYRNYNLLKEIAFKKRIQLVCVQYPMRSVKPLKRMLQDDDRVIFVNNEKVFKEAVRRDGYSAYFIDIFGGDFGHCTIEGNRLLAENIAKVILKEYLGKKYSIV